MFTFCFSFFLLSSSCGWMLTQLSCVHKILRFSIIHKDILFTQMFPIQFHTMSADIVISWLMQQNGNLIIRRKVKVQWFCISLLSGPPKRMKKIPHTFSVRVLKYDFTDNESNSSHSIFVSMFKSKAVRAVTRCQMLSLTHSISHHNLCSSVSCSNRVKKIVTKEGSMQQGLLLHAKDKLAREIILFWSLLLSKSQTSQLL